MKRQATGNNGCSERKAGSDDGRGEITASGDDRFNFAEGDKLRGDIPIKCAASGGINSSRN
jgi:hypothetical protein